jgi:glycosyltransferase involved in cell wall biosynthesis
VDIRFVGDYVKHSRGTKNNRKVYSLWDAYVDADFVSYPSYWEGYGNQFIEAVFAELPVVIYEHPVYKTDIEELGFDVVSLGDTLSGKDDRNLVTLEQSKINAAAKGIASILVNPDRYKTMTKKNDEIGHATLSYATLKSIIKDLFLKLGCELS